MKYSGYIDIGAPRDKVVRYFSDPAYLGEYQEGFLRKELQSGEMGKLGAVSKMYYHYGKHEMEITETIIANRLPDSFESHYHHQHMDNTMVCRFEELPDGRTRYHYAYEYTRIDWILPRLIALLFPGMYRKQGEKWLSNFKTFVEQV